MHIDLDQAESGRGFTRGSAWVGVELPVVAGYLDGGTVDRRLKQNRGPEGPRERISVSSASQLSP